MKAKSPTRIRLDALRRFAASLAAASGVKPDRAAAIVTQMLWFDAAGAPEFGVAGLPHLLGRIASGAIDPKSEGKVGLERASTAVLDGQNGVPALILSRAAGIATEKAREYGVGLVRVKGNGPAGPAAPIVSDIAVGPMLAVALGPDGAWSVALPDRDGPPWILDSSFGSDAKRVAGLVPWAPLTSAGEWLIQAVAVTALEPLSGLQERVADAAKTDRDDRLRPETLEAARREAREKGVMLSPSVRTSLREWAGKLGIADLE